MARPKKKVSRAHKKPQICPIILAAGSARRLGFPQALARFGDRTALEIGVENCASFAEPIVVLGCHAERVRAGVPRGARVVIHRGWRAGQLSSLRAGLRLVPRGAAVLLYPVDYPLLTARVVRRLADEFERGHGRHAIVVPVFRGRAGHPVIFSPAVRAELLKAPTARAVVDKDPARVQRIALNTPAICIDFNRPASYRRCKRMFSKREVPG